MKIDKLLSPFISVFIFVSLILSAFSAEADPQIDVSPGQLNVTLSAGQTAVETLTISNTGDVDLEIQIEPAREISAQGNVSGVPSGEHPVIIESKASRAASGTGPPVIQGKGGPDTFGYTWIDSDESGGPLFDYIDITTRGNAVGGLSDDNFVGPFPIGFAFPFYGVDYTEFYITSNGAIGFGPPDDYDELRNGQLPNPDSPNNTICWLWDDLEPRDGNVYYETIGNNIVIQFLNYGEFFGPGVVNAEVILSSNGEITLQYQNFQNSFDTQSATVGIENADGSDGLLIVLNTNYLHDGLAVKILSPEIGWLSVNPSSNTLPVGASVNVTVTFNTLGLLGGNYSANINVSAATPANLSVLVPVNLTVTEPRISVSPTQIDVGQVTFGTTLTQALNINNLAGTGGPALTFSIIESGFSVQADPSGLITPPTTGETAWDEDSQSQIPVYQRVNIPAAGQNLTPQSSTVNILWDDTHDNDGDDLFGNYFSFYDHLTGAGYNVVQLEVGAGPITSTTLSGYDIFVVVDPDLDFLTSEIDAVHDFVAQGGGLLIVGEPPQFNSQPTLDAILAPYGVQFTGGDFDDPAIGTFASHPITDGIQSVELGRHSSLNLSPPALALGFTNSGELVLGATEATGKVVVIADSSVMHNDWLPRADNLALMDNIFSWVITVGGEIPWLSVSPTAGAVEANGSLPITVSLNSTLSNGDYTAHLQIDHDDPSADPVSVQVKMTVIGASPEVATNPGSLDFGQVFTGEAMKKSLTVSNAGFDLLTVTDITSDEVVFTAEPTVFNLSPGNEKVVEVTFGPTSAGSVSAALTIASNDPDGALSVPLTGEGVVPSAISVTPGGLSESLFTGGTAAQSFTIANIGGSDLTFQIEVSEIAGVSYPPGEPAVIIETKGSDAASRTGPPVAQGRGGPDAFGYTWIDSDETGGPTFDYIDISGSGTRVSGLSDDNFAGPFPIGFSFSFYGIDYTDFYIASNGFIGFGPTSGYTSLSNVEIANPNTPNNIICWLWDDLHPRDGSVYYQTIGTELVVQFVDYGEYNASGRVDAEIILSANGQIELQYASLRDSFETQSSTIGIENLDGSDGLQVALNTAYLHDGLAVRISSGPSWLDVGPPIGGTISLGGNVAIPVTFNAIGLFGGDYSADIEISSNDSASPLVIVPASLNVTGVPDVAVDSTSIDFGEVALGAKKTENLTVSNTGTDLLTLTAITIDSSSFTVNLTFPVSVAPGSDQVVEITYVLTSVGSVSATLTIESDDPDGSLSVSLNAQGVATPWGVSPPNLSESLLSAGISTQSLTISNSGGSDLNFQIEVSEAAGFGPIGTDISGEPRAIIETKGSDIASGTGPPVTQGKGGPDTFGYTWIDSDEVGGPVFDYIDVSGSGNVAAGFSDDNFLGPFPIGFIFNFYGVDYTEFYISSNGFIGFGPTGAYAANSNRAIPDSNTPNNVICWLWDDLHPTGGVVYYQTIGGSTLVVQFVSYGEYGASGRVDAEVILSADGRIKFQYASFRDGFDTKGSTIGIENLDGSDGLQVALNTNYLHDALAVLISSGPGWLGVGPPTSGTIPSGGSVTTPVVFNATGLFGGDYSAEIVITSDNLTLPTATVSVSLDVTGVPDLSVNPASLDFSGVVVGESTSQSLTVSNIGTDQLDVTDITSTDSTYTVNLTSFSLAPGGNQVVTVTFTPTSIGEEAATLTIESNDPDGALPVSLSGQGGTPNSGIQITPKVLTFTSVTSNPTTNPTAMPQVNLHSYAAYAPGQVIVKFKTGALQGNPTITNGVAVTSSQSINQLARDLQISAIAPCFISTVSSLGDTYKLQMNTDQPMESTLQQLANDPAVEWIEPNYIYKAAALPNDFDASLQWSLEKIQAETGWDIERGKSSIVIAVSDSGVDHTHSDLGANIWNNPGEFANNGLDDDKNGFVDDDIGWDFVGNDRDPMDLHGHGTHVSGIASAATDNGIGIAGTTWNCRIMPVRGLDKNGSGFVSDLAAGIEYAANNGAHVINMSWGGGGASNVLQTALAYAHSLGVVLVAAAGNDNTNAIFYPAGYNEVIAVSASDRNDNRAGFSNFGDWIDVAAPGVDIHSTLPSDNYDAWSGTSMASPLVAGVTALLLSRNAALTPDDVRGIIVQSADDVGWKGRINMESALRSGGTVFAVHNTGNTTLSVTNITPENGSPWLTVSETQLTIPAGESASIEVSVDFSNLSVGQHTDRLLIASNIPNQNPYPDGVYVIAELTNTDPSIVSLTAAPNPVNEDETSQVSVIATDPDGHELTYSWSVSDGPISGTGSTVTYTPPDVNQQVAFIISVTVTDGFGGSDSTAMGIVVNPVGPTTVFGDADNDGQITAVDAAWVLEAVVGRRTTSSGDLVRCDVTGDGTCSALDAALILQFTVGIIPEFPVQSNSTTVAPGLHTTGTTYALHAEEIAAKRGEQVSLPIYLEKGEELLGGRFRIRYDSSLIAIHGVRRLDSEKMDKSNLLITQTDKPGNLIITFGRSEALKAGDLLATIDFELRPMVDKATAIVPFQIEDVVFNEGVALPVTFGEVRIIPGHTALFSNYPNPFNPETWIPYQLVGDADVTITIFHVQGHVVRRLHLGFQPAGFISIESEPPTGTDATASVSVWRAACISTPCGQGIFLRSENL